MTQKLPEGRYPFIDREIDLADMAMVEAPPELERLLKEQAAANGTEIIRDQPVELTLESEEFAATRLMVWYPSGQDRIHLLVPKEHVKGRA